MSRRRPQKPSPKPRRKLGLSLFRKNGQWCVAHARTDPDSGALIEVTMCLDTTDETKAQRTFAQLDRCIRRTFPELTEQQKRQHAAAFHQTIARILEDSRPSPKRARQGKSN